MPDKFPFFLSAWAILINFADFQAGIYMINFTKSKQLPHRFFTFL